MRALNHETYDPDETALKSRTSGSAGQEEWRDIRSCSEEELERVCRRYKVPGYRARQVFNGVHRRGARSWGEMPELGAEARGKLEAALGFESVRIVRDWCSGDGTRKYLMGLADGESVETVMVPDVAGGRRTLCLSAQVGCPVGCPFCATGQGGFCRNLTVGEIMAQVLEVSRAERMRSPDFKVSHVVFMGMGEPFLNRENFMNAVGLLNAERGLAIGMRRMTVSTCGVVPGIRHLAEIGSQMGLAVSLHSSFDSVRDVLVPMNRKYPLAVLMEACREYGSRTHRRITFEMALTRETCTSVEAYALTRLLKGLIAHVNLIPVNPVAAFGQGRPGKEAVRRFMAILQQERVPVSLREERGADIEAACGQLRRCLRSDACEPIIKM